MNLPDDAIVAGILSNDLNEVIFYIYKQYAELISFNVVTNELKRKKSGDERERTLRSDPEQPSNVEANGIVTT